MLSNYKVIGGLLRWVLKANFYDRSITPCLLWLSWQTNYSYKRLSQFQSIFEELDHSYSYKGCPRSTTPTHSYECSREPIRMNCPSNLFVSSAWHTFRNVKLSCTNLTLWKMENSGLSWTNTAPLIYTPFGQAVKWSWLIVWVAIYSQFNNRQILQGFKKKTCTKPFVARKQLGFGLPQWKLQFVCNPNYKYSHPFSFVVIPFRYQDLQYEMTMQQCHNQEKDTSNPL